MSENLRIVLKTLALLYVEDNKRFLDEVQNVFNNMFANTYTACDGQKALEFLENIKIDIIITDINMPNIDGIELIKKIREYNKTIPIIILTAHADKDLLLEASNLQIDGYITKPINFSKIATALSNAVQRIQYKSKHILCEGIVYDYTAKKILKDGIDEIELGKKESQLLDLLILNSNKITTKEEIIHHIWDMEDITDSALKNLLSNLRNKIGKDTIVNYPGRGWKIVT